MEVDTKEAGEAVEADTKEAGVVAESVAKAVGLVVAVLGEDVVAAEEAASH